MDYELRFTGLDVGGIELRADGAAKGIRGSAAVFDTPAIIGRWFEELIRPGAFDDVLRDSSDIVALFNHDANYVLGRQPDTLRVWADDRALRYEVPELPATRADVLEAIERKDVRGNSFSFSVAADGDEWFDRSKDGKLPLRIIHRVAEVRDVGPVVFPAYAATTVAARSAAHALGMAPAVCTGCSARDGRIATLEQELRRASLFRQPRKKLARRRWPT